MASKKILVVGSGGREHALVSTLKRSPSVGEVFCAPGNGGIENEASIVAIDASTDEGIDRLAAFAKSEGIDLTVVGPELPLVLGIVDRFERDGLRVFGPPASGARLEGSKVFTKEFLARHRIPTAAFEVFDEAEAARRHARERSAPMVVKADGLAAGKGVIVAKTQDEAIEAIDSMLVDRRFGESGHRVVIEDCLVGEEISILILTDGQHYVPLETAQDYKPAYDGGKGPNTGGMGSYSPYLKLSDPQVQRILETIIGPTLDGLRADDIEFRGVLYAGIMLTDDGPSVLEYNVRFGDPETQPILSRLRTDLAELFDAAVTPGGLERCVLEWDPRTAVCVVAASEGYPGSYPKGREITGLSAAEETSPGNVKVFHAGTKRDGDAIVTSGGRVLGITALADSRGAARDLAYAATAAIRFDGMQFRTDIAG